MNERKHAAQKFPDTELPSCKSHLVNLDNVRYVQPEILPMGEAQDMTEFFGVFADPNRLRLLSSFFCHFS